MTRHLTLPFAFLLCLYGCKETARSKVIVDSGASDASADTGTQMDARVTVPLDGQIPDVLFDNDGGDDFEDAADLGPEECDIHHDLSPTLQGLKDASCEIYCVLIDDKTNHACAQDGACQRLPEKFRKMCAFRFDEVIEACSANNEAQARQALIGAYGGIRDHLSLRTSYCQTDQVDCNFTFERLGIGVLETIFGMSFNYTPEQMKTGTLSEERDRLLSIAASLPTQTHLEPVAMSVAAEIIRRLNNSSVCAQ